MSRRRLSREQRRDRREVEAAVADLGESLLVVRDQRLFEPEFDTFDAYCVDRFPASCPAHWHLTEDQGQALVALALELAEGRRKLRRR